MAKSSQIKEQLYRPSVFVFNPFMTEAVTI